MVLEREIISSLVSGVGVGLASLVGLAVWDMQVMGSRRATVVRVGRVDLKMKIGGTCRLQSDKTSLMLSRRMHYSLQPQADSHSMMRLVEISLRKHDRYSSDYLSRI